MTRAGDVVVIGGGIIGCAVAHELARRGAAPTVLEARRIGAGATQASAGVLAPYIEAHQRGPLLDLTVRSLAMFDEFVAAVSSASGTAIDYRRNGTLEVAADPEAAARLKRAQEEAPDQLEWLDRGTAREAEPALADAVEGALLARTHGYVAVPPLVHALSAAAIAHGAAIEEGTPVRSIHRERDGFRIEMENGEPRAARQVVVAAGSWSSTLDPEAPAGSAVHPVRGQLLRLGWRGAPISHVLWGPDCYVVPWLDGTALVGATAEDVGFDQRATVAGVRDLLEAVSGLLPEAWGATFVDARAGLRPASHDGLPIVGESASVPGLFHATGHYRNGILLAPLTAALLAGAMLEGQSDPALELMRPGRSRRT